MSAPVASWPARRTNGQIALGDGEPSARTAGIASLWVNVVGALLTFPPSLSPAWCCCLRQEPWRRTARRLLLLCHTTVGDIRHHTSSTAIKSSTAPQRQKGGGVEKRRGWNQLVESFPNTYRLSITLLRQGVSSRALRIGARRASCVTHGRSDVREQN